MPAPSLYDSLLDQAVQASGGLVSTLVMAAKQSMHAQALLARDAVERERLEQGGRLLAQQAAQLGERFPAVLRTVFQRYDGSDAGHDDLVSQALHLDQLELMDEGQLQERVALARLLQHVLQQAEASLSELHSYVSALLGLARVCPQRNPLRPDSYVTALQQVMTGMNVPTRVRAMWLHHMAPALGQALDQAYQAWSDQLRRQNVRRAGFTVIRTPESTPAVKPTQPGRAQRAVWTPQYRQTVLTLDKLRRLMAGELEAPADDAMSAYARQFRNEFESGPGAAARATLAPLDTSFQTTVPAALDALQDMQQLDAVVQRMQQRPAAPVGRADGRSLAEAVRDDLSSAATSMSQVLSLEVVSQMVANLAQDTRLLAPVRKIIERLEPALLRLVIIDPRFFIDRMHPARQLLQEISQRGLAFAVEDDPEFRDFLLSLQRHVSPLSVLNIESVQPFEVALKQFLQDWDDPKVRTRLSSQIHSAAVVLGEAEARNLRAEQMVEKLRALPDMGRVQQEVADFVVGPWVQVMAQAELKDMSRSDDPGDYKMLVNDLLWSAQPTLTRKDVSRLTKLVPRLLSRLREGLNLIGYPSTQTSVFFDVLMQLHHQAFRPAAQAESQAVAKGVEEDRWGGHDHWVAPFEAKASGFMAFPDGQAQASPQPLVVESAPDALPVALTLGAWIELELKGHWQRMQLSWISPHGTMFLFTSARGKTQSMTQRFFDRLVAEGRLRVVSDQTSMVEGALDAVVHTALRNSIDSGG